MKDTKNQENVPKKANEIWKLWLGIIVFIVFAVGRNIEVYSEQGKANSQQMYKNAINASYEETYNSCAPDITEEECRQHAKDVAEFAAKKLAPMMNK